LRFGVADNGVDQVEEFFALFGGQLLDLGEVPQGLLVEGGQLSFDKQVIQGNSEHFGNLFAHFYGGTGIAPFTVVIFLHIPVSNSRPAPTEY